MPFPPVCFDCDKQISFDRYQIGVCPECEKELRMNDPNWHRSTENADELPRDTFCKCGHILGLHVPSDQAPCQICDCQGFDVEPSAESLRASNRGD